MASMRISVHVVDVPKESTPPEIHLKFTPLPEEEAVEAEVIALGVWTAESIAGMLSEVGAAITEHAGKPKPKRFNPRPT